MAVSFGEFFLEGIQLTQPTDVAFGPDGRLYILEQDGRLLRVEVAFENNAYTAVSTEVIDLVRDIQNHDVQGNPIDDEGRLALGLLVTGTPAAPQVYVSSADPNFPFQNRGNTDVLDSNSGILSRLTLDGETWSKVDLVRGLARGNTAHGISDMDIRLEEVDGEVKPFLYLNAGGMTNSGGVGPFFFFQPEFVYSGAILKIDLEALDALPLQTTDQLGRPLDPNAYYIYDLPTVDDPTRDTDGDINPLSGFDIFGSNNGLNQVKFDPSGPVDIYASGFRNAVGLVVTNTNQIYTSDNGPSDCCDRPPVFVNGVATNLPNFGQENPTNVQSPDALYLVTEGLYAGHPNPVRASGPDAGLFIPGTTTPVPVLPADWDDVLAGFDATTSPFADEAFFLNNGSVEDPAILSYPSSVNGIDQYEASFFDRAIENALILSRFTFSGSSNSDIIIIETDVSGEVVVSQQTFDIGGTFGGGLGLTTLGDDGPFPGTIWVAGQISNTIAILSPDGEPADPPEPPPADDRDEDGLKDFVTDAVPFDATNGGLARLGASDTIVWTFSPTTVPPGPANSIFNLGVTGAMTNGADTLADLFDDTNFFPGGAVGQLVLLEAGPGTALGAANTQRDAAQFAMSTDADVNAFTISVDISNPIPPILELASIRDGTSAGFAVGDGTQSDFVYFGAGFENGRAGFVVVVEEGDAEQTRLFVDLPVLADPSAVRTGDPLLLEFDVDAVAGTLVPRFAFDILDPIDGASTRTITGELPAVTVSGDVLAALQGTYTLTQDADSVTADPQDLASGPVISLLATTNGDDETFPVAWNVVQVSSRAGDPGLGFDLVSDAVALWTQSEVQPGVLVDASEFGNDGSLIGGVSVTANGLAGNGLQFDGATGRAVVPHSADFLLDEGTLAFWVNPERLGVDQGLVSKDAGFNGTGGHLDIRLLADGQLYVRLQNADAASDVLLVGPSLALNQWNHVAASFGPGGVEIFVNGTRVAANPYEGGLGATSGGAGNFEPLTLGATQRGSAPVSSEPAAEFLLGRMDEIVLSATKLSADAVAGVYQSGLSGVALDEVGLNRAPDAPFLVPAAPFLTAQSAGVIATVEARDPEGDPVAFSLVDDFGGLFALNGAELSLTRTLTLETLPDGFVSPDIGQIYAVLGLIADDGQGGMTQGDGIIVFDGQVGEVPVALDDEAETPEDTAIAIDVLANDSDADADPLTLDVLGGPANGSVSLEMGDAPGEGGPFFTYVPDPDFNGSDSFTYRVFDGNGNRADAAVTITITPVNDAPVAQDDAIAIEAGLDASGSVFTDNGAGADTDVDGPNLTVTALDGDEAAVGRAIALPSGGLLTVEADGSFRFEANGAYNTVIAGTPVTETVSYTLSDGALTDSAVLTLIIAAENVPPNARDDAFFITEDTGLTDSVIAPSVGDPDTDREGGALTLVAVNGVGMAVGLELTLLSGALLTVQADGTFTYDTNGAFEALGDGASALDGFMYTVEDGFGATDTAMVLITVDGVNDAPDARDDAVRASGFAGALGSVFADNGAGADGDVEGAALVVTAVDGVADTVGTGIMLASGGLLTVNTDGSFQFDANGAYTDLIPGMPVEESVSYTVSDGELTDTAVLTLTIEADNQDPEALDDAFSTEENTPLLDSVLSPSTGPADRDPEGFALTVTAVNGDPLLVGTAIVLPSGAALTVNADGGFAFDPQSAFDALASGASAIDGFDYTVEDGQGGSDTASVAVTLIGLNDAPEARDDAFTVIETGTLAASVLANNGGGADTDIDTPLSQLTVTAIDEVTLEAEPVTLASGALVTMGADGTFLYDPNGQFDALSAGESATDTFTYTLSDGEASDTANVSVVVLGEDDAPPFDLLAYWPVVEESAANVVDETGNGFDGVLNAGSALTADGFVGAGLAFDGTDGFVEVDHAPDMLLDEGGFTLWFNADTVARDQGLMSKDRAFNGDGGHIDLRLLQGGTLWLRLQNADSALDQVLTVQGIEAGTWNHVVVGFGSQGLTLSVNGAQVAESAYTGGLGSTSGGSGNEEPLVLGATLRANGVFPFERITQNFSGTIDEVGFLQSQPDAQTVADLYQFGLDGLSIGRPRPPMPPVAADDALTVEENEPGEIDLLANDRDPDDPPSDLTVLGLGPVEVNGIEGEALSAGSLLLDGTRVRFDPGADFDELDAGDTATVTTSYVLTDGTGLSDGAQIVITVQGINDAPVAVDDTGGTDEDSIVRFDVLANDSDVDADDTNDRLTVLAAVLTGGAGTVSLEGNEVVFDPSGANDALNEGETDTASIAVTIADPAGATSLSAITVTVTGTDDPAIARDDRFRIGEADTVSGSVTLDNGAGADSDPDDPLVVIAVNGQASNVGTQIALGSGAILTLGADGSFTYDPNGAFSPPPGLLELDQFTYTLAGSPAPATVTIEVAGFNGVPIVTNDTVAADEDTPASGSVLTGPGADEDPEGQALTVVAVNGDEGAVGTAVGLAGGGTITLGADGGYSFNPSGQYEALNVGDTATESFTYTVEDPLGARSTGTVIVTIEGVNDAPDAVDDAFTTVESATVTGSVLRGSGDDTDVDTPDDTLAVTAVNGVGTDVGQPILLPSGARLTLNGDGSFIYDPNGQFDGLEVGQSDTDSFTYGLSDGTLSDDATVTVTVNGESDFPTLDLLAYWSSTDDISPLLEDDTGNGFDGTLAAGAAFTAEGRVGSGLEFNGTASFVEVDHAPEMLLEEGGFSLWFNADTVGRDQGLLSKDRSFNGTGGHIDLRLLQGGVLWLRLQNADSTLDQVLSVQGLQAGDWHHVVVGFGDGGLSLSLNGLEVASSGYEGGLGVTSGGLGNQEPLVLGASLRSNGLGPQTRITQVFDGRIDEVAVLRSRPDADTVDALYQAGLEGLSLPGANANGSSVPAGNALALALCGCDDADSFNFASAATPTAPPLAPQVEVSFEHVATADGPDGEGDDADADSALLLFVETSEDTFGF